MGRQLADERTMVMAIIPTKDNFQIMPTGTGVRFDGGPKPTDVTRNGRIVAQGLMEFDKIRDEHERIDAAADANAFAQFLDKQQASLSERKGIHAYRNKDGTFVRDTLDRNIEDELGRMRSGMSASRREKFDMMVLPFQRNFNRETTRYIQTEYRNHEKATLENTQAQYGKMAFVNYASDPEMAHQALNDFHGVARYQAVRDGADDALADSIANNKVSGIVKGIIDDAIEKGDLKTAQAYQERFSKIMTFEDVAASRKRIKSLESIEDGRNFAREILLSDDVDPYLAANSHVESGNQKADKDGKTKRSLRNVNGTYDYGLYQLNEDNLEKAAKLAGEAADLDKLKNDPEYAARLGRAFALKIKDDYSREAQGDPRKLFAFYQCSPKTVRKAIAREKNGEDFMAALLPLIPEKNRKTVKDGIQAKVAKYEELLRKASPHISNNQFRLLAKEKYQNDKQRQQAAIDYFETQNNVRNEAAKLEQEETLNTVYDMADSGKTMTEIEQSGRLSALNHKNYRLAVDYIEKKTQYDFDLVAELDNDPEKLAQTNLGTLRGLAPRSDINRLARKQAMAKTKQGRNVLERLTFDMQTVLQENGINLNSKNKRDIKTRSELNDFMIASLEQFQADHKRYPTDKERLEMLRNAVGTIAVPVFGGLFTSSVKRYEATKQDFVDAMSTPERMRMIEAADAAGIYGTDDEKILAVLHRTGGFFK